MQVKMGKQQNTIGKQYETKGVKYSETQDRNLYI